ncbi:MAG TPA: alpha/beta fold hydrolase [Anaerolineales bacterium]|nr:alpha/beta fold hydrolase [Anaerolineales bacterium]
MLPTFRSRQMRWARPGLALACAAAVALLAGCGNPAPLPAAPTASVTSVAATLAPTPEGTPTLTTQQWLEPYTLRGLRERPWTPAKLVGREEKLKTSIFTRYAITYLSDGLRITGILQVPAQGKPPFPVIVMNHGFFNRIEYRAGDGTDRAAEYLNRRGYLTLSSDYRSWDGSEAGPSLYYSGLVIDVVNLMRAAESIPEADTGRIGMWGHSMGGGVTMKVLTLETPVKAAVLYSTVSADDADILARWGLGCIGDIEAGENQLGCNSSDVIPLDLPPELIKAYYEASLDAALLAGTSPIHNLELVSVPIQIHYGTRDGENMAGTPPEWSQKLFSALEAAGRPVELFGYDGERHSFVGDSWVAFMERSARFFDKYVRVPGP